MTPASQKPVETAHTPGPWFNDYWGVNTGPCKDDFQIAHCVGVDHEANARLIAAAPDMLAALKDCLPLFDNVAAGEVQERVVAAIAKAEGR